MFVGKVVSRICEGGSSARPSVILVVTSCMAMLTRGSGRDRRRGGGLEVLIPRLRGKMYGLERCSYSEMHMQGRRRRDAGSSESSESASCSPAIPAGHDISLGRVVRLKRISFWIPSLGGFDAVEIPSLGVLGAVEIPSLGC